MKKILIGLVLLSLMITQLAIAKTSAIGSLAVAGDDSYGSTVVVTANWDGVKRNANVRLQVLCTQDIGVVYGEAYDAEQPGDYTFVLGYPDPLRGSSVWDGSPADCRADLFTVTPNGEVTYLANKVIL